jgi:type II secretory pathway pseudopilin PulG
MSENLGLTADPKSARNSDGTRRGMILVTTLVFMLIVTIIGAGVLFTSQVELTTTSTYRQNMTAFNYADALAQLAVRAADVIASGTIDDVREHLQYHAAQSNLVIAVNDKLAELNTETGSDRLSIKNRYLTLGRVGANPDILVKDKSGNIIGTIMISHDFFKSSDGSNKQVGSTSGIADKGNTGVGSVSLQYYVITVSGKDPSSQGSNSFFNEDDEMGLSGSQSFITVLYSVVRTG